jgi:hypothetical protein
MEIQPQILIAVYPDGLLITIDGRSHFHHMSPRQMMYLAKDLIEKGVTWMPKETRDGLV